MKAFFLDLPYKFLSHTDASFISLALISLCLSLLTGLFMAWGEE